jgi:hypothetical protein
MAQGDLYVRAGSFEPWKWTATDPTSGLPLDLTAPGYSVVGVVSTANDGTGAKLLDLLDDEVWARTADGGIYFQPSSAVSSEWPSVSAYYQAYLYHPSGNRVRLPGGSRFVIDNDLLSSED